MDVLTEAGVKAYIARNDDHEPLCIYSAQGNDDGLFVELYTRGGQITAVEVYDGLTDGSTLIIGVDPPKAPRILEDAE
jgi:hypothetical protein